MNIGIIYYSKTGFTQSLAETIKDVLAAKGHSVQLSKLETKEPIPDNPTQMPKFTFLNMPDIGQYDAVFFGGPVWAFRPCPVLRQAIERNGSKLKGKIVVPFMTMGFPFAFMTGNSSVRSLKNLARSYGAKVTAGAVLPGKSKNNSAQKQKFAESLASALR
jgi:flavodoxin